MIDLIEKYFTLTDLQKKQFSDLIPLYKDWNQKINVISRKDIDNMVLHHVLHSLSIVKYISFVKGAKILDLGTGGGFPGIPLAIMFPDVDFTLIDGTNKKITVVNEVAKGLNLTNVTALQKRAEEHKDKFDFVVIRAVAKCIKLVEWTHHLFSDQHLHAIPNGIITLKGGDLKEELGELTKGSYFEIEKLSSYFEEAYFQEKSIVYLQAMNV